MPVGIGLHVILAIICAIHAVRTGQNNYWLFVLFAFPLLGSLVYFITIYLPSSRLERQAKKTVSNAVKALDPTRSIRQAQEDFDYTPTAQNQMRLAEACLAAGHADEAAKHYEACLNGPFASDLEVRFSAARAFAENQQHQRALSLLQSIAAEKPNFREQAVQLLTAHCHANLGNDNQAQMVFATCVEKFGTFEALAQYAIWALEAGKTEQVQQLETWIAEKTRRWTQAEKTLNDDTMRKLKAARKQAK